MTCDQAIEILPWYLNGTLEAGERAEVRRHLETCERCRAALAETGQAWSVFAQHIPAPDLVALAWGERPSGIDPALAEEHLASCAECAAELELARMSRRLEEEGNVALFPVAPAAKPRPAAGAVPRTWRAAAMAAGLAAVVAAGGWLHAVQGGHQLAQSKTPLAVDAADLGAASGVVRSAPQEFPNDRYSALLLTVNDSGNLAAEVSDETGKVSTKIPLNPIPIRGVYMLLLPAGLEPGGYTVQLLKDGSPVSGSTWTFRVVKPAAAPS
jgi:Putative zinc-finger